MLVLPAMVRYRAACFGDCWYFASYLGQRISDVNTLVRVLRTMTITYHLLRRIVHQLYHH